ncbi:ABC transporter ATP-binding protein [Anaplasmataceae bacterium AB001_6]|nr:ABC transporter ATP-binding protein [Anaplasmataceae bacterium AB001_6]
MTKKNMKHLKSFFKDYVYRYKWYFISSIMLIIMSGIVMVSIGHFLEIMVDYVTENDFYTVFKKYAALIMFFIACFSTIVFFRIYLLSIGAGKLFNDLRRSLYQKLVESPADFISKNKSSEMSNIFAGDVTVLYNIIVYDTPSFLRQIFVAFGSISMMLYSNFLLTVTTFFVIPILLFIVLFIAKTMRNKSQKYFATCAEMNDYFNETMYCIKIIKSFNRVENAHDKLLQLIENSFAQFRIYTFYRSILVFIIILTLLSLILFVLWKGITLVSSDVITPGRLLSFISYAVLTATSLGDIGSRYSRIQQFSVILEKIYNIFFYTPQNREYHLKEHKLKYDLTKDFQNLTVKNLCFSYHGNLKDKSKDETILSDVSFEINKGESLAIVGHSGAGKSTIFDVLLRFLREDSGEIVINNKINFTDLDVYNIRSLFTWVPQEMYLFSTDILSNILFFQDSLSKEELINKLKEYNIDRYFFDKTGYINKSVGEKGTNLSQGQKQLISIARAILNQGAPIILLDEFTSSLDVDTETSIQSILHDNKLTKIIIAHRLSTTAKVDKILVLKNGRVVEYGLRKDLLSNKKSEYYRMMKQLDHGMN